MHWSSCLGQPFHLLKNVYIHLEKIIWIIFLESFLCSESLVAISNRAKEILN